MLLASKLHKRTFMIDQYPQRRLVTLRRQARCRFEFDDVVRPIGQRCLDKIRPRHLCKLLLAALDSGAHFRF